MAKLKREIGLWGATLCVLGIIIGAGIYVIIGETAGISGNMVWLSFIIAAVIATLTGLSYAELASTYPRDSAEYLYSERAFNDRRFSFGVAWMKLATIIIASAAVALGFGNYLARLTGWNFVLCALLLMLVLTVINLIGIKQAMEFDTFLIILAIAGLLLVIGFGIFHLKSFDFYMQTPSGFSGIMTGAALIFFAFLGFENIGNISEEVKNPKRTLPLALLLAVVISSVLYILVALVAVSIIPWQELAHSSAPLSDVLTQIVGSKAGFVLAIMALGATGSTVLGLLIAGSRMVYGLAEEHSLPKLFLKTSRKSKMPYIAIIATSLVCVLFILPGDIKSVAFITDFASLFVFMIINICLIVLRYKEPNIPRGFTVPGRIGRFPVLPALGALTCAVLLFSFSKKVFVVGIITFLAGLLLYSVFGERKFKERMAAQAVEHRKKEIKRQSGKRKKH